MRPAVTLESDNKVINVGVGCAAFLGEGLGGLTALGGIYRNAATEMSKIRARPANEDVGFPKQITDHRKRPCSQGITVAAQFSKLTDWKSWSFE
jgi:hypothetical protein